MNKPIYAYKLLNQNMTSHNKCKWAIGVKQEKQNKTKTSMCSTDVFHCYSHPSLAILFNPIHANIKEPRLFKIKIDSVCNSDQLKQASHEQTLIKEIPLPEITLNQKIAFAIYCALAVYKKPSFIHWGKEWLSGKNRTAKAADDVYAAAAYDAYNDAAYDAAYAAAYAAANAAKNKQINFISIWNKAKKIT